MNRDTKRPSRLQMVKSGEAQSFDRDGRFFVSPEKVHEDPKNERKVYRNMDGLITSVQAFGVIEPITVTRLEDGSYQVVTGHRRLRAAKRAGLEQIEIIVRNPEDERRRRQKSIVSNVQREDIGPVELAEALQALLDEDDNVENQQQLAELIGKHKTWVSRMLGILKLPAEQQKQVRQSKRSLSYEALASVAKVNDPEQQKAMVKELLKGSSLKEMREKTSQSRSSSGSSGSQGSSSSPAKPTRVYRTKQEVSVVVQSDDEELPSERIVAALEEALEQAKDA
jgi:ParB family chromosome partitioning protein